MKKKNGTILRTAVDCLAALEQAVTEYRDGTITADALRVRTYAMQVAVNAIRSSVIEDRLSALDSEVKELRKRNAQ